MAVISFMIQAPDEVWINVGGFYSLLMDKLQLTGQNLGQVFNSRDGHVYAMHSWGY